MRSDQEGDSYNSDEEMERAGKLQDLASGRVPHVESFGQVMRHRNGTVCLNPETCMNFHESDTARGYLSMDCRICAPLACDDPDSHLGVPSKYTPLKNAGCHCGADLDGRDCVCFENE
jgi:hypothetical protein